MTPFPISLQTGIPISEQIVHAAKRAILTGHLRPGDPFPSVRTLSRDLRINPNTAHRAVTDLIDAGLLAMQPGIGTVVTHPPSVSARDRARLLAPQVEALVIEACRLGAGEQELLGLLQRQFNILTPKSGGQFRR